MALVVTEADRAVFYVFDSLACVFGVYFVLRSYELANFIGALGVCGLIFGPDVNNAYSMSVKSKKVE